MSPRARLATTLAASLGSGLCSGVFFAFSAFVMPALSRLSAAEGVSAMQAINVAAVDRWLPAVMLGTAFACAVAAVSGFFAWPKPGSGLRAFGAMLYLLGTLGVTRAFNIPLNDALAAVTPGTAAAAAVWQRYLVEWCAFNHVRSAAGLLGAALLALSLLRGRAPS